MDLRRLTPKVDQLLESEKLKDLSEPTRRFLASKIQVAISTKLKNTKFQDVEIEVEELVQSTIESEINCWFTPSYRGAINGTGIILHTGLGRARLASRATEAIEIVSRNHSIVEIDTETGLRGDRQARIREEICSLTGAESALVVNNCAAALSLVCMALGTKGDILISRGEIIEIGGQFRLPKIIEVSGSDMKEVGCTNKTYVHDYAEAIEAASMVLKCHPSNFRVEGFSHATSTSELSKLCKENQKTLVVDQGNGCIHNIEQYSLEHEITVQEELKAGADLVLFSGDKLLGGPQCGVIAGKKHLIDQLQEFPLARAFRIDKLSLAGLSATLKLHLSGELELIPTWRAIMLTQDQIKNITKDFLEKLNIPEITLIECESQIGGGSMPTQVLPSYGLCLKTDAPDKLAAFLRNLPVPVFGIIRKGCVVLDMRTIDEEDAEILVNALAIAAQI